jgi:hypothetical protein
VPTAELTARLWKSMALGGTGTLALLALGLIAARFTGQRLAQPIRALAALALAHGRGERIEIPPLRLKEANDLARAFVEASRLLEARTAAGIGQRRRDNRYSSRSMPRKKQPTFAPRISLICVTSCGPRLWPFSDPPSS